MYAYLTESFYLKLYTKYSQVNFLPSIYWILRVNFYMFFFDKFLQFDHVPNCDGLPQFFLVSPARRRRLHVAQKYNAYLQQEVRRPNADNNQFLFSLTYSIFFQTNSSGFIIIFHLLIKLLNFLVSKIFISLKVKFMYFHSFF